MYSKLESAYLLTLLISNPKMFFIPNIMFLVGLFIFLFINRIKILTDIYVAYEKFIKIST